MKSGTQYLRTLWAAALAAAVCGVGMTAIRFSSLSGEAERWQKKTGELEQIRALQAALERQERRVSAFAVYPAAVADMAPLLRNGFANKTTTIRELEAVPALPGWTGRRVCVTIEDVPGTDVEKFIEAAAALRPPWGLTELVLQASGKAGQLARADLTLVALEKAAP